METNLSNPNPEITASPERPDFLKILCILSFVGTGLMILLLGLGALSLGLSQETVDEIWPKMSENNPQFENLDGAEFFRQVGWFCVYGLLANIFSLIGVIMMWRLEKIGFYIYAASELVSNFLSLNINLGEQEKGYGGMIFWIIVDLVFIGLYFVNLKHMKGKPTAL